LVILKLSRVDAGLTLRLTTLFSVGITSFGVNFVRFHFMQRAAKNPFLRLEVLHGSVNGDTAVQHMK
jgi:hypothetical protein